MDVIKFGSYYIAKIDFRLQFLDVESLTRLTGEKAKADLGCRHQSSQNLRKRAIHKMCNKIRRSENSGCVSH